MKKTTALTLAVSMALGLFLSGCTVERVDGNQAATDTPDSSSTAPDNNSSSNGKRVLNVCSWGEYIADGLEEQFEEATGIEVNYVTVPSNEELYSLLQSGGVNYDVIVPSDYMISQLIEEDMLQELDYSKIPNFEKIDARFKNLSYDPENLYTVPYTWGTLGIIYNTTMVDEPITGWKDLWDEKYEKNLFMMNSVRDSMGIALILCGYDMNSRDPEEIEEAKNKLIEQKPLVLAYTGDEVKDKMVAGEAAMAVCYSGDAITMIEQNEDLAYVIPEEGSNLWFDNMCIPKGAPNKELAEQFINFMCSEEIAAENRDYINYSTPQQQVLDNLPDEIKNDPVQYPDEETLARCEIYKDLGDMASTYDEFWTKIMVN